MLMGYWVGKILLSNHSMKIFPILKALVVQASSETALYAFFLMQLPASKLLLWDQAISEMKLTTRPAP